MNIISFIIGIIGTLLSAYGAYLTVRSNQQTRKSKTIDWGQMQTACKYICKQLKNNFIPDAIITPGQKGGILAQLILDNLDLEIPIYTGFLISKEKKSNEILSENYILLETTKWNVFLPKSIEVSKDMKILIVDDLVMSGDFLYKLQNRLIEYGYSKKNIQSCSIATTTVANATKKSPDYYWKIVDADDCYFPWGKAR